MHARRCNFMVIHVVVWHEVLCSVSTTTCETWPSTIHSLIIFGMSSVLLYCQPKHIYLPVLLIQKRMK